MTTRTKLNIASLSTSAIILLNVCSRPLGISERGQWVLIIGVWIPLALTFFYIKRLKAERTRDLASGILSVSKVADDQRRGKKRLVIVWICMIPLVLSTPFWMPKLSGIDLGVGGNVIVAMITLGVASLIFGIRLKKWPSQPPPAMSAQENADGRD